MTYAEAAAYLYSLKPGGMKMGLARMQRILALCGNPERSLKTVHIAGTNGKGSTARMMQSICTAAGYRTGLYTSPEVTGLRDTVTINGEPIPETDFAQLTDELRAHAGDMGEAGGLSAFEAATAIALLYFAREHTDLCVIECGLGGRDDATNVIPAPLVAVLTPIALDHTAMLGSTVEEIAANKCGIMKPPCAVVCAPGQGPEALGVILERAAQLGLTVYIPNSAGAPVREAVPGRTSFVQGGRLYTVPLTGVFQRDNALTAIETVNCLRRQGFLITEEAVQQGLADAVLPCRQEVLRRQPLVMMDGAHNPHGVAQLAETLRQQAAGEDLTLLIGMLRDKDTAACVRLLQPYCRRVVCCTPENPRALPAAELAAQFSPGIPVRVCPEPRAALTMAREWQPKAGLLVAGSFYLCATLRPGLIGIV